MESVADEEALLLHGGAGGEQSYFIVHPEKIRWLDLFRLLFSSKKRRVTDYPFVETNLSPSSPQLVAGDDQAPFAISFIVAAMMKLLTLIEKPLALVGEWLEWWLNLYAINGGVANIVWNYLRGNLLNPIPEAKNFLSLLAHIDGRLDVYKEPKELDVPVLASKIVYENEKYIRHAVEQHLQGSDISYFSCWNADVEKNSTQAVVFYKKDEGKIYVAFRGTEFFNANDWKANVNFSLVEIGAGKGSVHLGWMRALGLQADPPLSDTGFPRQYPVHERDETLAYYEIRSAVFALLTKYPRADVRVVGHSQGGALAILFVMILLEHSPLMDPAVWVSKLEVITMGQPRVGDAQFARNMEERGLRYIRMVYRHDLVPRVPFDSPGYLFNFKHFGTCRYYHGWKNEYEKKDSEMPNPNYFFDGRFAARMEKEAWTDFVSASYPQGEIAKDPDFKEPYTSVIYRVIGLAFPGLAFHSPRDYLNSARLSTRRTGPIYKDKN